MSYTVFFSRTGTGLLTEDVSSKATSPAEAVSEVLEKAGLRREDVADVIVVLGITGSKVLHASKGLDRDVFRPTQEQLREAWDRIRPTPDWKAEVDAVVVPRSNQDLQVLLDAVTHFTGGASYATRLRGKAGKVRIRGAGYYASTGG